MDDSLKQRLLPAIVAFNLTVISFQIAFNSGLFGFNTTVPKFLLALLLGAAVGAGVFFAAAPKN